MKRTYREYYKATGNKENEFSKIDVNFQYGGMNYFNYKQERKGVYINFSIVERGDRFEKYSLFGSTSFKILALELNRKSQKHIDDVYNRINSIKDTLHDLHIKGDKPELLRIVNETFCATC